MFIECSRTGRSPYLKVSETYYVNESGKAKTRRRVIRNVGPLSRYDDGQPDYLARLRQSFKDGAPLIPELTDLAQGNPTKDKVTISFDRSVAQDCICDPKNIGYFLLDALYDALGIYDVLALHKSVSRVKYDLNGFAKLLIFGRVLSPDSKSETFMERKSYLFDVVSSDNLFEVYRALDCLNECSSAIQKRMAHKIVNSIGRNTEVCYYDVTNYYFEISRSDEDVLDMEGNVLQFGLRKRGVSKENRREPIVQMGMFIDDNGIPISYRLFPGNNIDQTTLRPALKKTVDSMKFGRVIIVADGGLNSGKNLAYILKSGNGYIVSKSPKKSTAAVKQWILDEDGYIWNKDRTSKTKSKICERTIEDEDGKKIKIKEKAVCYWSQKYYNKEVRENQTFMDYVNSVVEDPSKLKTRQKRIEKFLDKINVNPDTGEVIDTAACYSLNIEKIKQWQELMGYYMIVTSETEKSVDEIIAKYHGLSRIEDSFRIIKCQLEGRPVYVRTKEHINAHFLICFIALTMIRFIQYKVLKSQGKDTLNINGWEAGVTSEKIQKALASFQADLLPGGGAYYRITKPNDDMIAILNAIGISSDHRLPTAKDLRTLKLNIKRSVV